MVQNAVNRLAVYTAWRNWKSLFLPSGLFHIGKDFLFTKREMTIYNHQLMFGASIYQLGVLCFQNCAIEADMGSVLGGGGAIIFLF